MLELGMDEELHPNVLRGCDYLFMFWSLVNEAAGHWDNSGYRQYAYAL